MDFDFFFFFYYMHLGEKASEPCQNFRIKSSPPEMKQQLNQSYLSVGRLKQGKPSSASATFSKRWLNPPNKWPTCSVVASLCGGFLGGERHEDLETPGHSWNFGTQLNTECLIKCWLASRPFFSPHFLIQHVASSKSWSSNTYQLSWYIIRLNFQACITY